MEESLGQYLRRKREARLISLQEISHATGIGISQIKALEDDNFSSFHHQKIIKEYLKKCAAYLRLNEKNVLRYYQSQSGQNHPAVHWPQLSLFSEGETVSEHKADKKQFINTRITRGIFWISIIVWIIIVFSLFFFVLTPPEEATDGRKISAARHTGKDAIYEGNDRISSITEEKRETSQMQAPYRSVDHFASTPVSSLSAERDRRGKESGAQAKDIGRPMGKRKVIGNSDSKRYHLPGMKHYDKVKSYHRIIFNTEAEAIGAGYSKARE